LTPTIFFAELELLIKECWRYRYPTSLAGQFTFFLTQPTPFNGGSYRMKRLTPIIVLAVLALVGIISLGVAQAAARPADAEYNPFLTAPSTADAEEIARQYIREHTADLGISAPDADGWVLSDRSTSAQNGVTFIYLQQELDGIRVHNAIVNFGIMPDGRVLHVGNRAVADLRASANTNTPAISAADAVAQGAEALGLERPTTLTELENRGGAAQEVLFSDGGISLDSIPAKLVYQPLANGEVRLAWDIVIAQVNGLHWWQARVDAVTGQLLDKNDWVVNENLDVHSDEVAADHTSAEPMATTNQTVENSELLTGTYNVFALPAESPIHTTPASPADGRTSVTNPANASASPFGWHDTDGASGPEFTITRGNNVHAGLDLAAPNGVDAGSEPDGGAGLVFNNPIDLTQNASQYRPAVVTNLFYWNNIFHDVLHGYGFDEASGNFQQNNYGNGGLGNDYVMAEAQDYSGTNNANFATPVDGARPRMQMYIWTPPLTVTVEILTPASIAGIYYGSKANFGPDITAEGITGTIAIATDGTGVDPFDACEVVTNPTEVVGKIAIVNRGNCTFPIKVLNAQNAGAIAVIVANWVDTQPGSMGGTGAVTVPAVHIYRTLGNTIRTTINGGTDVTVNLRDDDLQIAERDSDLDAGVIIHEYGHGVSNRLTGGPSTVSCLSNQEQMGEGWSDWYGMAVTADANDTAIQPRGVGTYVNYEPVTGNGIRPAPYSTDLAVNPFTYANRADALISIPHGVGFLWSSMIWDMYWNLRMTEGYDPDVYNGTGGNNLAIQLVTDGLKLQPCSPGFEDGRDAIIAAAVANGMTQAEICTNIWAPFARRGMGFSADQGASTTVADGTVAYDMPTFCTSPTAVTLNTLGVANGNVALPVAAITLVGLVAGVMVWRHRRS
jgi:extracellular elastinolytic metalloproteinase